MADIHDKSSPSSNPKAASLVRPPGATAFLLLEVDSKFTGSNLGGFAIVHLDLDRVDHKKFDDP
jgi:hypothetical protein